MELFDLKIMASDHVFYNGKVQVLTIHTPNGSKQFLAHHAKTIYAITPGLLKIRKEDNSEIEVVSGFGSVIFSNNQAEVLVDTCETQEELDARRAKESLERAKERMRQKQSIREYYMSQASMARALARLQFKDKHIN